MIPKECKRLAEVDFPIAEVSKHSAREKSIRHGHPSTLHLWRAQRERRRQELERQRSLSLHAVERIASVMILPHPEREAPDGRRMRPSLETEDTKTRVVMEREEAQGRQFYLTYPQERILSAVSIESARTKIRTPSGKSQMLSAESFLEMASKRFPLTWSAYVRLPSVKNENARAFYETEALHGGRSIRQLDRQINTQFYERTALSKNKAAMLKKGQKALHEDIVTPEEEIKDPYVLEFLGLKDEYSETDLEEALIHHLETFLLELGGDFYFIGRQKRILIGDTYGFVDLVFYHRILKCHVLIDLKIENFTHENIGQLNTYVSWYRKNMMTDADNCPIGILLCTQKDHALVEYALAGMDNSLFVSKYQLELPSKEDMQRFLEEKIRETSET